MADASTATNASDAASIAAADPLELQRTLIRDGGHEVRNQLSVILLQLGMIADSGARRIEADVRMASDTVNRIALVGRLATETTAPMIDVDLSAIVDHVTARLAEQATHQRAAIEWVWRGSSRARAHRAYLGEALHSLLDNAVRHSNAGGRIVATIDDGPVFTIADEGPGIPERVAARLGRPFATGNPASAGVGLGLAIASGVARLHGGSLQIARSPLGGAAVVLDLRRQVPSTAGLEPA